MMAFQKLLSRLAGVTIGALLVCNLAHAFVIGDTVHGEYLDPDKSTVSANLGNAVVGAGSEYSLVFDGIPITVDFDDDTLSLIFSPGGPTSFSSPTFTGLHFSDALNNIADIGNVNISGISNLVFGLSRVDFDANNIFINLAGLDVSPDSSVTFRITHEEPSTDMPLPGTISLLGLGLLSVSLIRKAKKV